MITRRELESFEFLSFDCYGTLIDWESGILAALKPLLAAHGAALADRELLELYAELESSAESGPHLPYREVLGRVVDGFGKRLGFSPSPAERGRDRPLKRGPGPRGREPRGFAQPDRVI